MFLFWVYGFKLLVQSFWFVVSIQKVSRFLFWFDGVTSVQTKALDAKCCPKVSDLRLCLDRLCL